VIGTDAALSSAMRKLIGTSLSLLVVSLLVACGSGDPGADDPAGSDPPGDNADAQLPGKLAKRTPWGQYRCGDLSVKDLPHRACADDASLEWCRDSNNNPDAYVQCYVLCSAGATVTPASLGNTVASMGAWTCNSTGEKTTVVMRDPGTLALSGFGSEFKTDQPATVKITIEARLADGSVHNDWGSSLSVYYDNLHDASKAQRDDYFSVNATFNAEPGHTYQIDGGFSGNVIYNALTLGKELTCVPPAEFTVTIECQ
jgi:hypothetical protein